jgi:prepilin-type N-terminal cleavage/methylation domain-containing protein
MNRPDPNREIAPRGFTLIEVIVALSAGVLVSMAAFMLSKSATAFFQRESRVSNAQLGLTLAMNRLTGDIQRASLLSSPYPAQDPRVCNPGTWPAGLTGFSGITITNNTATANDTAQTPHLAGQDTIVIGGSMDTSEWFQVQSIVNNTTGPLLKMRAKPNEPATYRALYTVGNVTASLPCKLKPVFAPNTYPPTAPLPPTCTPPISSGRFAHIYQPETNLHWYGVIDSFTIDPNGAINVQLATTPAIPVKGASTCGLAVGDTGGGWLFSVVTRVKYDIQKWVGVTNNQYGLVVNDSPSAGAQATALQKVTGDDTRTELVRTEIGADGLDIPATQELVAEYAVDLRFGITVASLVTANNYNATVTSYPIADPPNTAVATQTATNPQRVRAVQVRLSVRTRAPDRDSDITPPADGRRSRFLVSATLSPAYARVRTNYANVALPNQGGFALW